jgi:uncharacterized protein YndB with AHSA1/START domain
VSSFRSPDDLSELEMQSLDRDEVSVFIQATPEQVYAQVTDVTKMPTFSPELVECRWLNGATGAAIGARFVARNKVTRGPSWRNKPVITSLDPGRLISWARTEPFGGTVEWTYRFDPVDGGTRVTESYRVTKPIGRIGWLIIGTMSATKDRRGQLRTGMQETLHRLKAAVEAESSLPA